MCDIVQFIHCRPCIIFHLYRYNIADRFPLIIQHINNVASQLLIAEINVSEALHTITVLQDIGEIYCTVIMCPLHCEVCVVVMKTNWC